MSANVDVVSLLYASRNSDIYSALNNAQSEKEYVDSVSTVASMGSLALSFFSFGASIGVDIAIQTISDYYKYAALADAKSASTISMEESYSVGEPGSRVSLIANSILNEGALNSLSSKIDMSSVVSEGKKNNDDQILSGEIDIDSLSNHIITK